ncbi:hypothetical protein GGX14DRAFT_653628 [Mycena pura]|uniref:Uncharacterized protein n=1 Tax=Mycena pura TaxID=153505 RepID=A0AAD6V4M8_9AGAR|nr:hypothetical protein GGX14DRAFT_653628 [Mycena pura]
MSSAPHVSPDPVSDKPVARKYRFPPFPEAPEGVAPIPFKDFKESGIQVFTADDEAEKDGLGIPTIALRVKHDMDVSKTNSNYKKKPVREMAAARPGWRNEWWEDWEEGEDLRNHGPYNINSAAIDRFHQAASDFQKYRRFPPIVTNVQGLWDQFRIFAGLLGMPPVWNVASENKAEDDGQVSDDDFEEDSKPKFVNQGGPGEKRYPPRLRPRAPYELYGKDPVIVQDNDEIKELLDEARATKEDKVVDFLEDPGRQIQIFLSSYMKNQGLVWTDRNLINAPHLLRFFVRYLLRNGVLPDKTSERSLRSALDIIDIAAKELPLTAEVSKLLPDDFSVACQSHWGRKVGYVWDVSDSDSVDSVAGEPDAKRVKLDSAPVDAFESVLKEENVEVLKKEDLEAEAEADSAWGEPDADDASPPAADPNNPWDAAGESDWNPPARPSLLALLGPTALPLTHTPGIVEWSVRRVKELLPPPASRPPLPAAAAGAPDAEAVEHAVEAGMWRAVLAPWPAWDARDADPALSAPRILRSSLGALAQPGDAATEAARGPAGLKPHDMLRDDITLLVQPAAAAKLCVGMGLGGTWVQLARVQDHTQPDGDEAVDGAVDKKKKKSLTKAQKERRGLRYWYLDELMMILPSYWLA